MSSEARDGQPQDRAPGEISAQQRGQRPEQVWTLLLRGAQSDLLSLETAQAMTQRGPHALFRLVGSLLHRASQGQGVGQLQETPELLREPLDRRNAVGVFAVSHLGLLTDELRRAGP